MKIHGYEAHKYGVDKGRLPSLQEVTLQASVDELREIVLFIENAIKRMEKAGKAFGHEHLSDFSKKALKDGSDIIIAGN